MSAKNPYTGGVEGADPDALSPVSDLLTDTLTHIACGFIRKGNCNDVVGIDSLFFY